MSMGFPCFPSDRSAFAPYNKFTKNVATAGKSTIRTETITSEKTIRGLGFSLCWIAQAKAQEKLWDFNLVRKCGLLSWLARAQHDHYQKQKRKRI